MTIAEQTALLAEWLDYLDAQVGTSVYVWSAQGQRADQVGGDVEAWIRGRYDNGDTDAAERAVDFYRQMAARQPPAAIRFFDCSGLGMYFWKNLKKIAKSDMNADSMYKYCDPISHWSQLRPGDWVFKRDTETGKMRHIGYVARDGQVIEAVQSGNGVERHPVKKKSWTHGGRLKGIADAIAAYGADTPTEAAPDARERTVKQWQSLLLLWDAGCLPTRGADGSYNDETDAAAAALIDALTAFRISHGA